MGLTYQPFAETPAVDGLRADLEMNVSDAERIASGVLGVALVSAGITRGGLSRLALFVLGAALVKRALTGKCELYDHLQCDTRHGHSGVRGNRGTRIERSIEIRCSPDVLYGFWRDLENIPRLFPMVVSVRPKTPNRSHWTISGPGGKSFEWDAEIINDHEDRLISWQSLPGAAVSSAGSVRFEPSLGGTRVKVALEYDPPGGSLGAALSESLGPSPSRSLEEGLEKLREIGEKELGS